MKRNILILAAAGSSVGLTAFAEDWPMWGGTPDRNMVSHEKGIVTNFDPGETTPGSDEIDPATTQNCLWVQKLGSQSYGTPIIANGQIFVGTNNESPRDPKHIGDRGVVMAFNAETGEFQWQLITTKLGASKVSDWEFLGMCSTPTIVGDKGYLVTNRCEVVCIDVKGLSDGNQGFQDEAKVMTPPGEDLLKPGETDADILWVYDMRAELGVFPHNITSCYALVDDGKVYVTSSNGVDWSHKNIPAPNAPTVVVLDAESGELAAEDGVGISERVLHCSWASPALAVIDGQKQIIFGAGDGWCYGFNPEPKVEEEDGEMYHMLEDFWRYDANPPHYRKGEDGEPIKYATVKGPSEIIATPVVYKNKIYTLIGQDPEHGEGVGMLSCIDPSKKGDLSGKAEWTYEGIERSISTPSIVDDLIYAADYTGLLHCIDALTGEKYWEYDTLGHIWGSPMVVDGRVYIGNEEGELAVLKHGKELEKLDVIKFSAPLYGSPVVANGILYISSQTHLYAFGERKS